jgi:hypothetical protein
VLSAVYLTVEARGMGDDVLADRFRRRALVAGAVTAIIGLLAALLARAEAPVLWQGLVGQALPFTLLAMLIGLATLVALLRKADEIARILVAAGTAGILVAWGVAQWPYLIVPDVTVDNAASPSSVLGPLLIVSLFGLAVLLPSLWYLFSVVKRQARAGRSSRAPGAGAGAGVGDGGRLTTASFVASLQPSVPPVTPVSSPSDTDAFSAHAPSNAASASSAVLRVAPILAALLATIAAPLVTSTYGTLRQSFERRRSSSQRPRQTL